MYKLQHMLLSISNTRFDAYAFKMLQTIYVCIDRVVTLVSGTTSNKTHMPSLFVK